MRPYTIRRAAGLTSLSESQNVYAGFREELLVKELLFNFGPRKLMRLVRFEGGRVVSIETAGYGRIPQKE
jgi:hypothetical protein